MNCNRLDSSFLEL